MQGISATPEGQPQGDGEREEAACQPAVAAAGSPQAQTRPCEPLLGVMRVDGAEELTQFFSTQDAVCKIRFEFFKGQFPII